MNLSDFMDAYVTNLIRDHTRLCKRFAKAQQYFDNPNIAKSYLVGSFGSYFRKLRSNYKSALASFCFLVNNPNFRATFPECTSSGQDK